MSEHERKRRMISVRISEAEYEVLRKTCRDFGARNISDFARLAMQRVIGGGHSFDLDLALKVHEIDDRLKVVEARKAPALEPGIATP